MKPLLEVIPRELEDSVAPVSGPWLRIWLGDVPIWIDAGTLQALVASKAGGLLDGLTAGAPGPLAMMLRGALPGVLRMVLDLARAGIDNGTLDLPRPEPPKRGDVLAYFVSWATSSLVDLLTECDWRATYTETQDGGCAITALAPCPIVAGEAADGAGDAQRPGGDHTEDGERDDRPDEQ